MHQTVNISPNIAFAPPFFGGNTKLRIDANGNESALCYLDDSSENFHTFSSTNQNGVAIDYSFPRFSDENVSFLRLAQFEKCEFTAVNDHFENQHNEKKDRLSLKTVNANGRIHDPVIAVFLSPDPYVQSPSSSQNMNRYAYCMHNPLNYTDPSGEFFFAAVGVGVLLNAACWGAAISGAAYTASVATSDGGFNNWDWGQFGKSVGIGAISGVATAGIGTAFGAVGSNGIVGEIGRSYCHAFAQGSISEVFGSDFMSGFVAGGVSSLTSSAFMYTPYANNNFANYAFSTVSAGVGAELTGGDFWQGAAIGIMNVGLNHLRTISDEWSSKWFANKKAAYKYMLKHSFDKNGNPLREVSAYELENGNVIVNPYYKNTIDESVNRSMYRLSDGSLVAKFGDKYYVIDTQAHTHPTYVDNKKYPKYGIGVSDSDIIMSIQMGKPINIIYQNHRYSVWGQKISKDTYTKFYKQHEAIF